MNRRTISMFALNNRVPTAVATLSSQMKMKGLRTNTSAIEKSSRKTPYARALRMKREIAAMTQSGQMKNKNTAMGW